MLGRKARITSLIKSFASKPLTVSGTALKSLRKLPSISALPTLSSSMGITASRPVRAACLVAVGAGVCIACATWAAPDTQNAIPEEAYAAAVEQPAEHQHMWQKNAQIVHHDAVTHVENHDAVYGNKAVSHTVCNVCQETIDGITEEHADATGHAGYTTGVLLAEPHLIQPAWTETIVDQAAYEELVYPTQTCSLCNETQDIG